MNTDSERVARSQTIHVPATSTKVATLRCFVPVSAIVSGYTDTRISQSDTELTQRRLDVNQETIVAEVVVTHLQAVHHNRHNAKADTTIAMISEGCGVGLGTMPAAPRDMYNLQSAAEQFAEAISTGHTTPCSRNFVIYCEPVSSKPAKCSSRKIKSNARS
eukprot:3906-Heterococcus_DN1.PRE.1